MLWFSLSLLLICVTLLSCGNKQTPPPATEATTTPEVTDAAPVIRDLPVSATSGDYSVGLSWNAPSDGADLYKILYRYAGTGDYQLLLQTPKTSCNWNGALWGTEYDFVVQAYSGEQLIAESQALTAKSNGVRANDGAPKDDKMTVFFKQVGDGKSDGFAVFINGEVYLIDCGEKEDHEMNSHLMSLRSAWLAELGIADTKDAKLAINIVISHFHGDHVGALETLVRNNLFAVENVYYSSVSEYVHDSSRSYRTKITSALIACHKNVNTVKLNFGERQTVKFRFSDAKLDLFAPSMDWGKTYEGEAVRGWPYICTLYSSETNRGSAVINSNSTWAKFTDPSGKSVLFTGDTLDKSFILEAMMNFYGRENFDVDVLKYIHHGQKRFAPALTKTTTPSIIVYTVDTFDFTIAKLNDCLDDSAKYGDIYAVMQGSLTITFDHGSIIPSGIEPYRTKTEAPTT